MKIKLKLQEINYKNTDKKRIKSVKYKLEKRITGKSCYIRAIRINFYILHKFLT